ncbi:hypothetical protein QCA50_015082 [Cerrena zonata]|uniref:carbamoyl-phosphate synthase (glutamine-hydrolyzing) n=1 Tax=Cerrena zonata TaxID=2478898 RepID=A0AAW0FJY7_9APHY
MENFDPLGIHTGDSIVVAPSQTLSDADYNMLRTTAIQRHSNTASSRSTLVFRVPPRLLRRLPDTLLPFIAAKLGLGIPLNEIKNSVTKGEVMSIGRTFEETIQKAIRAIDDQFSGFSKNDIVDDIDEELANPTDKRMFALWSAFNKGYTVEKIWQMTNIDKWFLNKLHNIFRMESRLNECNVSTINPNVLRQAKQLGFSDRQLAACMNSTELAVRRLRQENSIAPFVKQIDTVAAEFPAFTNYLYTTYNAIEHDITFEDRGVMVLGSGVYRIGSSVEFDWCAVRAIRTLRENGFQTIMVNYNPETVSTDYDEADKLYFENISLETILDIYDTERARGVILSMGGQTPNNIALPLYRQNVKIFGTSPEMIDTCLRTDSSSLVFWTISVSTNLSGRSFPALTRPTLSVRMLVTPCSFDLLTFCRVPL